MTKINKRQSGFTMIELLVASTIMIVLVTIGMVSYRNAGKTSRDAKRKADLQIVRQALVLQKADGIDYTVGSDFDAIVNGLKGDYLTEEDIEDPKGADPYVYAYNCCTNGKFTLSATLESGEGGTYTLSSP